MKEVNALKKSVVIIKYILKAIIALIIISIVIRTGYSFVRSYEIKKAINDSLYINIYACSYERKELKAYSETELEEQICKRILNPKQYFKTIKYKYGHPLFKGSLYARVYLKSNEIIELRWSHYGDFFTVRGKDGYYKYYKRI